MQAMQRVFICAVYLFFTTMGTTMIKMGGQGSGGGIRLMGYFLPYKLAAGVFCYGLSFLLYTAVISRMQVSLAVPVLSALNVCIAVFIGLAVFKEHLRCGQLAGVGIVILGVFVIGCFSRG